MLSADDLISYASASTDTCATEELQQRLSMYQVFLKLYEHNRGLLNEILHLENSGSKSLAGVALPYLQGIVLDQRVYLITNLLGGKTQALVQPQQAWTIGRDHRKVSIAIQDGRLSRCHALIQYTSGKGFHLTDLGSSNGSFINGEQVWRSAVLRDGDRVRLGSLSFVFFVCQTAQTLAPMVSQVQTHQDVQNVLGQGGDSDLAGQLVPPHQPAQASKEAASPTVNPLQETFTFLHLKTHKPQDL
ncbi:MAG TPA: FHA domain-containing protein [Coleofasciculaceae cyanobacterium]